MKMRGRIMRGSSALALALAALSANGATADVTTAGDLRLTPMGSFVAPTYVIGAPGDARRVFVVEKRGTIRVIRDGTLLADPFLTVPQVHDDGHGEQGLLSIAFAPDYARSRRFYVAYSDISACDPSGMMCDLRVDEFRSAAADPDHAVASTRRKVLSISHRDSPYHNGGQLEFGPDGLLYLGTGDGSRGGDPNGNAQNTASLLGKLLRINPLPAGSAPFQVPAGNPFRGSTPGADEVWAYGLRNPWRFSFDHLTGDLAIADVGQTSHEEIDFERNTHGRRANYGWNVFEGFAPFAGTTAPPNYAPPVLAYDHVDGNCGIIGGYVSRDRTVARLAGRYVYGDLCKGELRATILSPGAAQQDGVLADEGDPAAAPLTVLGLSSFGEDTLCRVYVASINGPVYRIDSAMPAAAPGCARVPLSLSSVSLLRHRFAVAAGRTAVSGVPHGTRLNYTLSNPATARIELAAKLPGRRVGRTCRAPSPANRSRTPCTRFVTAGQLTRRAQSGANTTPFTGRIGSHALASGRYRAIIGATDADGDSARTRTLDFTVVAG